MDATAEEKLQRSVRDRLKDSCSEKKIPRERQMHFPCSVEETRVDVRRGADWRGVLNRRGVGVAELMHPFRSREGQVRSSKVTT